MKKNIWIINMFAGSLFSGSGERHFFLAQNWINEGYNVTIISSTYNHMFKNCVIGKKNYNFEVIDNILFCWVKTPKYNPQSYMRFFAMFIFSIKAFFVPLKNNKPDIIIVSSQPLFTSVTGYLLKKRYSARKFIFEIRDLWPLSLQLLMNLKNWHPSIYILSFFERFGYKKSDYIVSVLPNAGRHICKFIDDPTKLYYIPNGTNHELLKNEKLPNEISKIFPKNKFIVGYAGTLGMANAMEFFLEAACIAVDQAPFVHFVIVGDGYLKDTFVHKYGFLPNVTFIPKLKKSYVQDLLHHFDVCYIGWRNSSLYEYGVSANKYFDYMLASKPILVSTNSALDLVHASKSGLVVPAEDSKAILEGILKLNSLDENERNLMGNNGKNFVIRFHDIKTLAKNYEFLFI